MNDYYKAGEKLLKPNIAEFNTAIAEIEDVSNPEDAQHPLQTRMKFIFATNEGAKLSTALAAPKQGIKEEDFDEVIRTAINAPVKLRYMGVRGIGNHIGSIPIGHIVGMVKTTLDDGVKALLAEAVLYTQEFPEEVKYLKEAYASGKAPGISYEIIHSADSPVENGVQWLKNMITQAATIVRSPAYGNRTAILALASNKDLTTEEFTSGILELITPQVPTNKGGSEMDEKDKKIKELEERIVALAAEKETEVTTGKTLKTQIDELTGQLDTLKAENSTYKRNELLTTRTKAFTDAGLTLEADASKADAKKEFWSKMDDATFTEYVADLKAASEKATALASASGHGTRIPRLAVASNGEGKSLDELKAELRVRN